MMILLKKSLPLRHESKQGGFTLVEVLVSLALSSLVLLAVTSSLTNLIGLSHDQKIRTTTQLQAQGVIDLMVPELRMIRNGVPFHQANFLIAQAGLTDATVTEPILANSTTSSQISFRLNQTGEMYILAADFDPSASSVVTLTSTDKIYVDDEIYITNSTVGLDEGFYGVVTVVNSGTNQVTFAAGSEYSPGGTFPKGSLFEVVPVITYTSTASYGGITRDDGNGAISLAPNGQFTIAFLDTDGNEITLPLVASSADPFPASAIQNVRSALVTVQIQSENTMKDGSHYIATAQQAVSIRNLNYKY